MNAQDYEEALEMTSQLQGERQVVTRYGPVQDFEAQVAGTLWDFMTSVFNRVTEEHAFKQEVRDELRARMSEMDVGMLMSLYNRLNDHENKSVQTAMMPFVPKEGRSSEGGGSLMDALRSAGESPEQALHDEADPEVLQGIQQLNALLNRVSEEEGDS